MKNRISGYYQADDGDTEPPTRGDALSALGRLLELNRQFCTHMTETADCKHVDVSMPISILCDDAEATYLIGISAEARVTVSDHKAIAAAIIEIAEDLLSAAVRIERDAEGRGGALVN